MDQNSQNLYQQPPMPNTRFPAPEEQNPEKEIKNHDLGDFRWLWIIATIAVAFLVCIIAWIIISDGSVLISKLANHIMRLFDGATLNPYDRYGFARFVQIFLIAGFVAWAIARFKKKK